LIRASALPVRPTWALRGSLLPFLTAHVLAVGLPFVVGVSWQALALCAFMYVSRMFVLTGGYHRYFSHRSYKTSRPVQFLIALLGTLAMQKGALWWASHHRHHHRYSDSELDVHSPTRRGFWWSHMGWILAPDYVETDWKRIQDFSKFPELLWLDRHNLWPGLLVLGAIWAFLGTQMMVWGGLVSTVLLWHGTFTINSLSHVFGNRRYETDDTSRNSLLLALITLGEGWHNNHHHHQASANQGFRWYEIDLTFYGLVLLERLGIVWDVKRAPADIL
jgi:stearoyl-CoA desaturase (Delta-9 desaturase)